MGACVSNLERKAVSKMKSIANFLAIVSYFYFTTYQVRSVWFVETRKPQIKVNRLLPKKRFAKSKLSSPNEKMKIPLFGNWWMLPIFLISYLWFGLSSSKVIFSKHKTFCCVLFKKYLTGIRHSSIIQKTKWRKLKSLFCIHKNTTFSPWAAGCCPDVSVVAPCHIRDWEHWTKARNQIKVVRLTFSVDVLSFSWGHLLKDCPPPFHTGLHQRNVCMAQRLTSQCWWQWASPTFCFLLEDIEGMWVRSYW